MPLQLFIREVIYQRISTLELKLIYNTKIDILFKF